MTRRGRAQRFLFNPQEVVNDPAVLTMSGEAAGAYFRLVCRAWDMSVPGHIPNDDAVLASLSQAGPRWTAIRDEVLRGFDRDDVSRTLVQRHLVESHNEQDILRDKWRKDKRKQRIGRGGQSVEVHSMSTVGSGSSAGSGIVQKDIFSCSPAVSESVSTAAQKEKPKARVKTQTPEEKNWEENFHVHAWPVCWRKVGKAAALAAWMKIRPMSAEMMNRIVDAMEADRAVFLRDHEEQFRPHLSTWLNGKRWEDERNG